MNISEAYEWRQIHTCTHLHKNPIHVINGLRHVQVDWIPAFYLLSSTRLSLVWRVLAINLQTPFLLICVSMLRAYKHASMTDSSISKKPALVKMRSFSGKLSRDKWIDAKWLSIEASRSSKQNSPDTPLESPHTTERDWRKHDILFIWANFINASERNEHPALDNLE